MVRNYLVRLMILATAGAALYMIRTPLISKEITIRSQDKLDRSLARYPIAVLFLYDRKGTCPEARRSVEKALTIFKQTSRDSYFRDAGLQFLVVDTGANLLSDYVCDACQVLELPAVIAFEQGQLMVNSEGMVDALYSLRNRAQLTQFIQDTLGAQLQEQIEQKDAERKRRLEESRIQFYESAYDPLEGDYAGDYSWAYPYWGYGYGEPFGPGYVGVGVGFGAGW